MAICTALTVMESCVTKRKKNETSKFGKFYHNTTSLYNGYWNANELVRLSMIDMRNANIDNYSQILEVEDFVNLPDPKMVKTDMDKVIEKVTTVAQLHGAGDWVDDCYVMMARAQYLKHEYETAEETLEYFEEDFNPGNPYGRNFKSKKLSGKAAKRMKKLAQKEKEIERKEVAEKKEEVREERVKSNKEKADDRKQLAKDKAKAREKAAKEKAKARKEGKKVPKTETKTPEPIQTKTTEVKKPVIAVVENKDIEDDSKDKKVKTPKPQEDRSAYSEGKLWLAKTYIKRDNYTGANSILNKLSETLTNDEVAKELPATYASLYIKQGDLDAAIPKLIEAIELANSRQLKARYAFIAGQIYQQQKVYDKAYVYFDKAKDWSVNVEMEFVADLAAFKNGILSGNTTPEKAIELLTKRLKDIKYQNFQDQMYFTIGEIEMSRKNEEAGLAAFRSAAALGTNPRIKIDAYYTIADIYYRKESYFKAWQYFDSTSTVMPKTDVRIEQVQKYASSLKDIANQIDIIQTQDSMIYLASISVENQKKAYKEYYLRNVDKPVINDPSTKSSGGTKPQLNKIDYSGSNFFAYNEQGKKKGKEDFIKVWGDRPLEDDWRRSNKSSSFASADAPSSDNATDSLSKDSKDNDITNSEGYKQFVKDLPNNPIKKQEALDKIMNASFVLGKLYRDKLEKYAKSVETLEGMHTRFGPTPFELESHYYLYLDYLSLNDAAGVARIKLKILDKYPDSKYSTILRDPNSYAKSNDANKPDKYYDGVYDLFKNEKYADVISAADRAVTVLEGNNPYQAKFALLRAMSLGSTQGKDAYIQGLMALIATYPNTSEELKAKEILRFLGGDKSAFSSIGVQDVDKIYEKNDDEKHYVAVVAYQLDEAAIINIKIAISDYNKANYKLERLQLGDAILSIDNNSSVIIVRTFENGIKAMDYYKKVVNDKVAFLGSENVNVDMFAISNRNYRKMLSEGNANGYRLFFDNNYTKDK